MSALSDHFEVTIGGESREIFMSFGLLRDLNRTFPDPQALPQVFILPDQFELALWVLLLPRTKAGKPETDEFDLDAVEIGRDDAVALVKWGLEHLMAFFLKKLGTLPKLGEESAEEMQALLSAFPGLKGSLGMSPSAGPTESSEALSESSTGVSPTPT